VVERRRGLPSLKTWFGCEEDKFRQRHQKKEGGKASLTDVIKSRVLKTKKRSIVMKLENFEQASSKRKSRRKRVGRSNERKKW